MHNRSLAGRRAGARAAAVVAVVAALLAVSAPARAVPLQPGQVVLVAGLGPTGFSGDGGPARAARIAVASIAVGADGSVYLTDTARVRRVAPDGVIDTVYAPGPGHRPTITGMAAIPGGGLYLTLDDRDERVLGRMTPGGAVTVVAREAALGAATSGIGHGDDVAVDAAGNAYLYDATRKRVVRVDAAGRVSRFGEAAVDVPGARLAVTEGRTVVMTAVQNQSNAGGNVQTIGPTGRPRTVATTSTGPPTAPVVAADGRVYYVDLGREQVMLLGEDGAAVPVGPALDGIGDLAVGPDGDLYVSRVESLTHTSQVLRLVRHGEASAAEPVAEARSAWADDGPGTVHTVAGSGKRPPPARERPPVPEDERVPDGLAVGADGTVYVAERYRDQVRAIAPDGAVRRFAGTGEGGETDGVFHGDVATEVVLNGPTGIAVAADGVYVTANGRLYRVTPDGKIDTVATGAATGRGSLDAPRFVVVGPEGTVYYSDYTSIHRLTQDGQEMVVGYDRGAPDGTPEARQTFLRDVRWFAVGADGSVYFVQGPGDVCETTWPAVTLLRFSLRGAESARSRRPTVQLGRGADHGLRPGVVR